MNILVITHFLNGLLMILMPVALGIYLTRRFRLGWRLWWIGVGTFILSQVGHIPFNYALTMLFKGGVLPEPPENYRLIFNALVLGLSAGLWEEAARYLSYRFWAKDARSWSKGLLMGGGHGGVEAILLGAIVLLNYLNMVVVQNMDLGALLPPEQVELAQQQVSAYWSMSWYYPMLGALERLSVITFHLAASVLVLQVFLRKQIRWLWLAIGLHTVLDSTAIYAVSTWGSYITAALVVGLALISLGIIFWIRPTVDDATPVEDLPGVSAHRVVSAREISVPEIEETPEILEQTRYT